MAYLTEDGLNRLIELLDEDLQIIEDEGNLDRGALWDTVFSDVLEYITIMQEEHLIRKEVPDDARITETKNGIQISFNNDSKEDVKRIRDLCDDIGWKHTKSSGDKYVAGEEISRVYVFAQPDESVNRSP